MIYTKNIVTKYEVDVFVAGGGPAGIAAALSAARQGKKVFIAESNGCFGGMGTTGLVPSFCQFSDGENLLTGGIGNEIRSKLYGDNGARNIGFFTFDVEVLKKLYDDIIRAERNIDFSFFTRVIDVVANDGHVEYAVLSAKSGIFAVKAKIYVDCTGDGDLCAWAGADFELGNEEGLCMPATLCSLWSNIDFSKRAESKHPSEVIEKAFEDKVFTLEDRHIPGIMRTNEKYGIGGGNIGHCYEIDATDERSLTSGMLRGRSYMSEFKKFYEEYIGGAFSDIHLCYTADMLGIRESRRVVGDYVLSGKDFSDRAVFDDEIGRYAYPIDIHAMKPDKDAYIKFSKEYEKDMRYSVGESYGIPYRALTPSKLTNVLVAGRCISTDRQMQGSVRVMPGCYITGQAAGIAASLSCEKEDIRSFDIRELQKKICDIGGYLPNFR